MLDPKEDGLSNVSGPIPSWEARSVTKETEHPFVDWIFASGPSRFSLFGLLGIAAPVVAYPRVPLARLDLAGGARGDVDALILLDGDPSRACAVELKRVTVSEDTFVTELPGKLGEADKAIEQGNRLVRLGFTSSWTVFLVQIDGRGRSGWLSSGLTESLERAIEAKLSVELAAPQLGVGRLDVCQPVDKRVTLGGTLMPRRYRRAARREQSRELTAAIAAYVKTALPFEEEELLFSGVVSMAEVMRGQRGNESR